MADYTETKRESFLDNWMFQLMVLCFSLIIAATILDYHSTIPSNIANETGISIFFYELVHAPAPVLVIMIIIDFVTNLCLSKLLSKWRELPRNKRAYERETAKQRQKDDAKMVIKEKFKRLKEKAESGKKLTEEEEKWLGSYMGPIWYATIKRNKEKPLIGVTIIPKK